MARENPSCTVSVEYMRSDPIQEDTTEDQWHLLWSSDRLEIVLKDIAPYVNADEGRRMTIVEECRKRWIKNAYLRDDDDEEETVEP